jgi:beta-glucosidase
LGAKIAKPYVRGVQSKRVLASVKHFINNNQETCRSLSNSIVDERTRFEVYYQPFIGAIEADVAMQMCGYNQVNGVDNCGSKEILDDDLRKALGFRGWVQSDWWALKDTQMGLTGGVDQEMPGTPAGPNEVHYTDAAMDGWAMEEIDKRVRPQLNLMLKYGLFERDDDYCQWADNCNETIMKDVVTNPDRQQFSRDMATKAVVLLKNPVGVLPFEGFKADQPFKIALLGEACDANSTIDWSQMGNWQHGTYYFIGGSGRVVPKKVVTIKEGISQQCDKSPGCTLVTDFTNNVDSSVALAADANVAILCGGAWSTEDLDRPHLEVDQSAFITDAAARITTKKVVLTMTPGTIIMPWIANVDAALTVFNAGKYTGNAFADVLFGEQNPSAKSPVMYPKTEDGTVRPEMPPAGMTCTGVPQDSSGANVGDGVAPSAEVLQINYTEKLCVTWHCVERSKQRFPFGHGLSYTTFEYSSFQISDVATDSCQNQDADKGAAVLCITVNVRNSGSRTGTEIPQLYMAYPSGLDEPARVLRGFHRLDDITVGASMRADFPIYKRDMQIYSVERKAWIDAAGTYTFYVGSSENDIRAEQQYQVASNAALTYV